MMEWRKDEIIKLIRVYKHFDCLWDHRIEKYKFKELRRNAWIEIGKKLNKDVDEVKKRIKHLRTVYVSEKKKTEKLRKTSISDVEYEPHLFYYHEFNFLDDLVVRRKQNNNNSKFDDMEDYEHETVYIKHDKSMTPTQSEASQSPKPEYPSPPQSISGKSREQLKRKLDHSYSIVNDCSGELSSSSPSDTAEKVCLAFGTTLSLQLQQLSMIEATETMSEIHNLVSKKLLKSMMRKRQRGGISSLNGETECVILQEHLLDDDMLVETL